MHIQSRTGVIASDQVAATAFALEIAEVVESTLGTTLGVWQGLLGAPLGSITWSSEVDNLADLLARQTKLMDNPDYVERVTEAGRQGLFIPGSFQDRVARVVHTAGTPGEVGLVSILSAVALPGKLNDALAFATSIADYASSLTGAGVRVAVQNYGAPGTVTFYAGYAGPDSFDEAQEAIAGDAGYQSRVAQAGELFQPGSTQTVLAQRLH